MTKIFLNYRRADSIATAGRLHDSLAAAFGGKNVFMDIDSIPVGVDFIAHLDRHVGACDVLLALVGHSWLTARDDQGQARLFDQRDYVATEIAAALARDIPVIPVLIDGAAMPTGEQLPEPLKLFASRNAFQLRNEQFRSDATRLAEKIRETIGDSSTPAGKSRLAAVLLAGIAVVVLATLIWGLVFRQAAGPSKDAPPPAATVAPNVQAAVVPIPKAASYCEAIKSILASSAGRFETILGRTFGDNRIARIPLDDWEDCIVFMESRFTDARRYSCRVTGFANLATAESAAEGIARDIKGNCLGSTWSVVPSFDTERQRRMRLVDQNSNVTVTIRPSKELTTSDWLVLLDVE